MVANISETAVNTNDTEAIPTSTFIDGYARITIAKCTGHALCSDVTNT